MVNQNDASFYSEAKGYVDREFRVFHLSDAPCSDISLHFHNFRKVVILLKGHIGYVVEGVSYDLHSGDVVVVDKGELHRPVFQNDKEYERIIIYLSDSFFAEKNGEGRSINAGLADCFRSASTSGHHVVSGKIIRQELVEGIAIGMTDEACATSGMSRFLQKLKVSEFLVRLNDIYRSEDFKEFEGTAINETILNVMNFISENLSDNLSNEVLAEQVHLSKYYLMHLFKEETGYTLKEFITDKRLIAAGELMDKGRPLTEVCFECGFTNYSGFYRAYVDKYGYSPRKTKRHLEKVN